VDALQACAAAQRLLSAQTPLWSSARCPPFRGAKWRIAAQVGDPGAQHLLASRMRQFSALPVSATARQAHIPRSPALSPYISSKRYVLVCASRGMQ